MESEREVTRAPGQLISQSFSNAKCGLGDREPPPVRSAKAGEVNYGQGAILRGVGWGGGTGGWKEGDPTWLAQQEAQGLLPARRQPDPCRCCSAGSSAGRKPGQAWPAICHFRGEGPHSPGQGKEEPSWIWKLGSQEQRQTEGGQNWTRLTFRHATLCSG